MKSRLSLLLLLAACDNLSGGKAAQPDLVTKELNHVPVVITPHLGAEFVKDHCFSWQLACTHMHEENGVRYAEIYAPEPVDFNDFNTLETLGHECWHGLGAQHK